MRCKHFVFWLACSPLNWHIVQNSFVTVNDTDFMDPLSALILHMMQN
jgi:hypothetical protein